MGAGYYSRRGNPLGKGLVSSFVLVGAGVAYLAGGCEIVPTKELRGSSCIVSIC